MFDSIKLYKEAPIDLDGLIRRLAEYGYKRQDSVDEPGDFAKRGGIVDVFPAGFEAPIRVELYGNRVHSIRSFNIATSVSIENHTAVIIVPNILHKQNVVSSCSIDSPIDNFVDIALGDYVVHINHGIGIYRGIEKLKTSYGYKDYLCIEYAQGDRLYVPTDELHLVQRFIGLQEKCPKLYKLGSGMWEKIKQQTSRGVKEIAGELLAVQAARDALDGFRFFPDIDWQKKLEEEFPYNETPHQLRATLEVKQDMESLKPMDRLLCGDVGYGKTEVVLRAAFKAVMSNKQVAILVPTTILCQQHYATFSKRLSHYPVNVCMLSRFTPYSHQQKIIERLRDGSVDIVIGTHRLLSGDVRFKDLGLVVIDEEQRFGVKDKEKLKKFRLLVDVLTTTATPIPRTLYLSLMGARDMSIINTPPQDRQPVETRLVRYDERFIREGVLKELKRDGQVFFVHNRVEALERLHHKIVSLLPEAKCAFAHGRMPDRTLEKVMSEFIEGKIDILISTSIIESGIDIPNANTIFINRADTMGLADLYQLRGRVGRFTQKAYAYLLIPKGMVLTKEAKQRLQTVARYTDLGAGFKIAIEDLKIRGAGNILGNQQHGYIMAVGFDLYCRLLREAVERLKKQDSGTRIPRI